MSGGAAVRVAGLRDQDITIDGVSVKHPHTLYPRPTLMQALSQTASGGYRLDIVHGGDFLPNVGDIYDFTLAYDLDSQYEDEIDRYERLRTSGVVHTLCYWKKLAYRYTGISGQAYFYLPRPDAYGHAGKIADSYKAEVKVGGVAISAANTLYPGAVTSGTSVSAGQVKISTVPVLHPLSGRMVTLFKFGSVPASGAIIEVDFHPLFNVFVDNVDTLPFLGDKPHVEDKVIRFLEAA